MAVKAKHRVIIDTNLWISFLLTNNYSKIDRLLMSDTILLLFSEELIAEFIEVAQRPKFKKYFGLEDLEELLTKVREKAKFILVTNSVTICRDPDDNFLLSLAIDGKATHLITGDKDLLALQKLGKTKIVTITEFLMKN